MRLLDQAYEHPVRAGRIRLTVFRQDGGYLVTEARDGPTIVYATLGLFEIEEQALGRAAERAQQLEQQRYRKVAS